MQNDPLAFDVAALKAHHIQRHGTVLGGLVFDAEVNRRRIQDERYAALTAEQKTLQAEISALRLAHGERRAKSQVGMDAAYAGYLALCREAADLDSREQAEVAPLMARNRDLQEEQRAIAIPRLNERELQNLAIYTSTNSAFLRSLDKKLPPDAGPPLDELARINMGGPRRD
jgi:hypothetical protein